MDDDLKPLSEDVRGHTMMFPPEGHHDDGRECSYHWRLDKWTPDGLNECLRSHEKTS